MKLTEILSKECVCVPLNASDKTGAITELVDTLADAGKLTDRDDVLESVLARESTRSTGIGYGLAVPHGKSKGCPRLAMAVGRPVEPIDFDAADGQAVKFIVLLASPPDQTGPHIQALARISRLMLMEQFREKIGEAATAEEMFQIISGYEQ